MTIKIGKLKKEDDPNADEVRILRDSSDKMHRIIMPKVYWESFDLLLDTDGWTSEELVDIQLRDAKELGVPVEEYFKSGIAYMHQLLNEATQELRDGESEP